MLRLKNIVKDYVTADTCVHALRDVSLEFRKCEFVSILGASGCGKTTMLNIIGGLDRYTSGDLLVNGKSTKLYTDRDWDAYRNRSIGFVFQNYNLINNLTLLENVELALTLSGESKKVRDEKARIALERVGLKEQQNKRPNQLSGGQMQRVAIARAIVNNPEIILADEPTGALDSKTSVQIMDILKEIAKERLVIMVTHNSDIALEYSTRIINLKDGEVIDDTDPYVSAETLSADAIESIEAVMKTETQDSAKKDKKLKKIKQPRAKRQKGDPKTSMSYFTALSLSFKNLLTKKTRTILTAFAGSIGIIGIALVLSLSNGFSLYINKIQSDTMAGSPITVSEDFMSSMIQEYMSGGITDAFGGSSDENKKEYPDDDFITTYQPPVMDFHINRITDDYVDYVSKIDKNLVNSVNYNYKVNMNVISKTDKGRYNKIGSNISFTEMYNNTDFMGVQYDVIKGQMPTAANEVALIVDKYNQLSVSMLNELGFTPTDGKVSFDDIIGSSPKELKLIYNDEFYSYDESKGVYTRNTNYSSLYNSSKSYTLKITGILRIKKGTIAAGYSSGIVYTPALTQTVLDKAKDSEIVKAQLSAGVNKDVLTGEAFDNKMPGSMGFTVPGYTAKDNYSLRLKELGALKTPYSINIYPKDFESKDAIVSYLDAYNVGRPSLAQIKYSDLASVITETMNAVVNIISYVLIAFAAISLIVSSIMIGIITYVSVIERTKEIGILRSIGARKKDISRVFNAETIIIGFSAGLIGVLLSALLTIPLNLIINAFAHVAGIAVLNPLHAVVLVLVSMVLTTISGLIPSSLAAKKDPVVALRTD